MKVLLTLMICDYHDMFVFLVGSVASLKQKALQRVAKKKKENYSNILKFLIMALPTLAIEDCFDNLDIAPLDNDTESRRSARIQLSPRVSSSQRDRYSPKLSPMARSAKHKRRSVMAAGNYGGSRMASVRNKRALGFTKLEDLIESPSAKANGLFHLPKHEKEVISEQENIAGNEKSLEAKDFTDVAETQPAVISNLHVTSPVVKIASAKDKRRSILAIQEVTRSRIASAQQKLREGKSLAESINSPSAQASGLTTFSSGEPKLACSRSKSNRRSIAQIQEFSSLRIKSAISKERAGLPLARILASPSAQRRGIIEEEEEEEEDDDDDY